MRSDLSRTDPIRNLVLKDLTVELDLDIEEEILKAYCETIIEEICTFSIDSNTY